MDLIQYRVRELTAKKVLMLCVGDGGGKKNRARERDWMTGRRKS